jgi:glycosyltransferase involved in cell wall biosynthesis
VRLCLVAQEYPPETARGGIGSQTYNKARMLARLGHEVHVLSCSSTLGPELRTETHDGVTVHRMLPPGEEPGREFDVEEQALYDVGYTWSVARHLAGLESDERFDVIDFAEYGGEGFGYQINQRPWRRTPVVVQLHGPLTMFAERIGWPAMDSEFLRVVGFMEERSVQLADAVMACSANIADFTAERHGIDRDGIDVVHCGVDAQQFRPDGDERDMTVLFVGNVAHNKGLRVVFDAVMELRPRYPMLRLEVVGKGDDRLASELEDEARRAGAADAINIRGFLGDRDELPRLYRRAALFSSPADHEVGVANVYIEAMASACPVVAATTGAAREAVEDGIAGLLVPPRDTEATVAAFDRLLGDADLRKRMGQAGRERVEEQFALERYIEKVLAVYERAIERAGA